MHDFQELVVLYPFGNLLRFVSCQVDRFSALARGCVDREFVATFCAGFVVRLIPEVLLPLDVCVSKLLICPEACFSFFVALFLLFFFRP